MHAALNSFMEMVNSEIPTPEEKETPQWTLPLPIPGQGTVAFQIRNVGKPLPPYSLRLRGEHGDVLLQAAVEDKRVTLHWKTKRGEQKSVFAPVATPLLSFPQSSMYLWVSIDKINERVKIGHGYMMNRNTLLSVNVAEPVIDGQPRQRSVVANVEMVELFPQLPLASTKVNRLPVVQDPPPVVVPVDELTLGHIDENTAIPVPVLPMEAQRLYGTVAGRSIGLSQDDVDAIRYSLATPGKALYRKVDDKRNPAAPNRVYLRVTIGPNEGNSPGSPFVLEIWPPGCYSAVHDHSNTVAIIKVLSGKIQVRWFNPIPADGNFGDPPPIDETIFGEGSATWLSPEMYQTHALKNPSDSMPCITLQSYKYLDSDVRHYETFDFITPDRKDKQHFEPTSDFTLSEMLALVRAENREAMLAVG